MIMHPPQKKNKNKKQTNKKAKRENTFFTALVNQFQTFKLELKETNACAAAYLFLYRYFLTHSHLGALCLLYINSNMKMMMQIMFSDNQELVNGRYTPFCLLLPRVSSTNLLACRCC